MQTISKFKNLLIYIAALYLVVGGSFEVFSLIPTLSFVTTTIRYLNFIALLVLTLTVKVQTQTKVLPLLLCLLFYIFSSGTIFSFSVGFLDVMMEVIFLLLFIEKYEIEQKQWHLYKAFINIMFVLALGSLVLWILGPVLGKLAPTASYFIERGDKTRLFNNFYYICFSCHEMDFMDFFVAPNNCIFREKAFAATLFAIALIGELFVTKRRSIIVVTIFAAAMLSTVSATSIVLGLVIIALFMFSRSNLKISLSHIITLIVAIVIVSILQNVMEDKLDTHSGESRLSDLTNGIAAWINHPLFGYGYNPQQVYTQYSTGYSSSISIILISGGIYLMSLYIIPLLKTLRTSFRKADSSMLCFVLSTIVMLSMNRCAFLPIVFYLLLNMFYVLPKYDYSNGKEI